MLCIQHGMENGGRISWEKKNSSVSINAKKTNNAPNSVERFKVTMVLMVMFNMWYSSVTFCWFALHETLILLSCCVFIEMVNCLNTIILKIICHYCLKHQFFICFIVIIPPKICTTHLLLSIEFSILLLVTSCIM